MGVVLKNGSKKEEDERRRERGEEEVRAAERQRRRGLEEERQSEAHVKAHRQQPLQHAHPPAPQPGEAVQPQALQQPPGLLHSKQRHCHPRVSHHTLFPPLLFFSSTHPHPSRCRPPHCPHQGPAVNSPPQPRRRNGLSRQSSSQRSGLSQSRPHQPPDQLPQKPPRIHLFVVVIITIFSLSIFSLSILPTVPLGFVGC